MAKGDLPLLREDLKIDKTASGADGAPHWVIYDPLAHRFYKIGWTAFECLRRLADCRRPDDLVRAVNAETTLTIDTETVEDLSVFLVRNQLVQGNTAQSSAQHERRTKRAEKPFWKRALHGYLFVTLPLFKPQNFLERSLPLLRPLLSQRFMLMMLCLLAAGLLMTFQRMDEFLHSFQNILNWEGATLIALTTVFVKTLHELGHAYTATKYGVKVPVIGVAFIVLYPVLYTETTGVWSLTDRRKRVAIAAAGVLTEISLAAIALLLWRFLPVGLGKSTAFFVALVSLTGSLLVNLNPLMKFDGYYLLSDVLGIENLQDRACLWAKWRLRRMLWGWKDDVPEDIPLRQRRFFQSFGFALWIYRLFLFLGIAWVVFALFFPPLNIFLMVVEIAWFIALPIWREVTVWWRQRQKSYHSLHSLISLCVIIGVFVAVTMPRAHKITIPAVLHSAAYTHLYTPVAGKLIEVNMTAGQQVKKGDVLAVIESPQLQQQIALAELDYQSLQKLRNQQQILARDHPEQEPLTEKLAAAAQKLSGLREQQQRLVIKADLSGILTDVAGDMHQGRWINPAQRLGILVQPDILTISGYIHENKREKITLGRAGLFYPDTDFAENFPVRLDKLAENSSDTLHWPELSARFGGAIPTDETPGKTGLTARYGLYAAQFSVEADIKDFAPNPRVVRGMVRLESSAESVLWIFWQKLAAFWGRESAL
ncbi:MAG: biotin/lipoyl-binding protein [Pseudomonadota bacterium]|nr:biotin/lipoyl-binding protein [Pseudomonadota bacterium]QKK05666.1 MAG: biotin/lipoyl-binding protein [Pseudomonadota bacterium]